MVHTTCREAVPLRWKMVAAVVAAGAALALGKPAMASVAPFTDLSAVPATAPAIAQLQRLGVVEGVGGGRFDPLALATPATVATIAGRLFRWDPLPADAPPGTPAWAKGYLGHAVSRGYAPAGVAPNGSASVAMVVAAVEVGIGWSGGVAEARSRGLLCTGTTLSAPATRAEAALLLYRAAFQDHIAAWAGYIASYTPHSVFLSHGVPLFTFHYEPGCG